MQVVLDTNVLVSALLFKGRLSRIYEAIAHRELTLCFTETTFSEFASVIQRSKFERTLRRYGLSAGNVIRFVRRSARIIRTPARIPKVIVEDRADDHILAAAAAGQANCIVSGDTHLVRLGFLDDIPILTPRQFLAVL